MVWDDGGPIDGLRGRQTGELEGLYDVLALLESSHRYSPMAVSFIELRLYTPHRQIHASGFSHGWAMPSGSPGTIHEICMPIYLRPVIVSPSRDRIGGLAV